jgi:hypothetical protein
MMHHCGNQDVQYFLPLHIWSTLQKKFLYAKYFLLLRKIVLLAALKAVRSCHLRQLEMRLLDCQYGENTQEKVTAREHRYIQKP